MNLERFLDFFRRYGTFLFLVMVTVTFIIFVPQFGTLSNLRLLLFQISVLCVVSIGVTFVYVTGELDVSTGGLASLAGVLATVLLMKGWSTGNAVLASLAMGLVFGIVNGTLVGYMGVPALLASFATSVIALGLNFLLCGGTSILLYGEAAREDFLYLGQGQAAGIPVPFVFTTAIFGVSWLFLERTGWGQRMYAVGGNRLGAVLFGIDTSWWRFISFVICAFCAALAGVLLAARLGTGSPIGGQNYTLDAIAAVYIGVSMFREGEAHLLGTVLGVLIFGILTNALSLMGVNYELQSIIRGVLILGAVAITGGRAQLQTKLF